MSEKLVRDGIPKIIRDSGEEPITRILSDEEYLVALDDKLKEEVVEYLIANDLDELADIIEVIRAIASARGSSMEYIDGVREDKLQKRGGFQNKISLIND